MRVSTSEVLDSLNQLQLINPTDEQQFRSLLRSNFAKSLRDVQHFDRLYHLFFHEMRMETTDIRQAADYSEQIKKTAEILKKTPHDNPVYDAVIDFLQGVEPYENDIVVDFSETDGRVRMLVTLTGMHSPEMSGMQQQGMESQLTKLDARFS